MFVENAKRNSYLKISDEEILKAIDEAVLDYNVDGYTQHCEPVLCQNCNKDSWVEHDVFDYIAMKLRELYQNKCTNKNNLL